MGTVADRCYGLPDGTVVQASEPPSPELAGALLSLAAAARAAFEADPDHDAIVARQEAARTRNHARLIRLGMHRPDSCAYCAEQPGGGK